MMRERRPVTRNVVTRLSVEDAGSGWLRLGLNGEDWFLPPDGVDALMESLTLVCPEVAARAVAGPHLPPSPR